MIRKLTILLMEGHRRHLYYDRIAEFMLSKGATIPIRCKDCKYYEIHRPKVLENCERNGYLIPMKPDDFCSYGERKSDE